MKRLGISMVEILIVIGIIMFLGAISYPAFRSAVEESHKSACVSNLKQLYSATQLYRQDWGGDGVYGNMYAMGLPPGAIHEVLPIYFKLRCADAGNDFFTAHGVHYYTFWLEPEEDGTAPPWASYSVAHQGESVLIADMNHNEKWIPLMTGDLITRFGMAVRENGSIVRKRKRGDWLTKTWWN